jgi:hypothetical protein
MRNNLQFTLHNGSPFKVHILHYFIFHTSDAKDKYINVSINKDINVLQNHVTSFNPVFFIIKINAESKISFVRTSVLLLF